jgi:hypothetical protein
MMENFPWDDAVLRAANVNPQTGLATDYLNVFNEPIMLIEMVPDCPELVEELAGWQGRSYFDHFSQSQFQSREVVLAAYEHAPGRAELDALSQALSRRLEMLIDQVVSASAEEAALILSQALGSVRRDAASLDRIIHGGTNQQDAIDALF